MTSDERRAMFAALAERNAALRRADERVTTCSDRVNAMAHISALDSPVKRQALRDLRAAIDTRRAIGRGRMETA